MMERHSHPFVGVYPKDGYRTQWRYPAMATEYTVTYAFNGYLRGEYSEAISRISETVAQLQREGVDVEFCGATLNINGTGQLITVSARYEAPSKGAIGRLNCRGCLPASGPPQDDGKEVSQSAIRHGALTGG